MAINTLITLKDALTTFVSQHEQLQRIEFEADDHRAPKITDGDEFPMLFVAPISVQMGNAMNMHTIRIYVYERINDDRGDVWENANDTSLMLRDIKVWWNGYSDTDIMIMGEPSGEFKCDAELDNVVGYFSDFIFEIPSHGRCDVPINVVPSPTPSCADATYLVQYTDGTLIEAGTIPSGGSKTINVPLCEDAIWELRDTDGTLLDSGTIASGGSATITAPDATVDNSDATYSASVASGGTLILPDSQLNVNSVDVGDVVSVKTIDVNVTDGDGDTLAPIISLVGNTLGLVVPSEWAYFTIENSASANIRMTTNSGGNFIVDWGDGTVTSYASGNVDRLHTYASPYSGVVRVKAVNGLSDINQFRSTLGNWNFDIGLFNQLSGLTQAYFSGNSMTLTGDIASLSNLTFEAYFSGSSMTITGDIASLSNLTFRAYFLGSSMTLTGDIASLSNLTYQALFIGNSMTITGDIASLSNLTFQAYFSGSSMTLTGDISALSNLTYQAYFSGSSMTITGDIASLSNLTFQAYFIGSSMTITGDIASLSNLTYQALFIGNSMTLSYTSTTWTTIPSYSILFSLATGFLATSTEVDNLLIDLEATGASGSATIDLRYNNAPRTTASDAAVSALTSRGYTVLTN